MIYNKNYNDLYIELLHRLTNQDFYLCLSDKRILDKKVFDLVRFLRKLQKGEKNESR